MEDKNMEWKAQVGWDNLALDERIVMLEREGKFDVDIMDDPPAPELLPNQIDYVQKRLITKIKSKIANSASQIGINGFIKKGMFEIKAINGLENWQNVKGGAILTCNHFSPNDTFVMQKVFKASKKKKLFRVIREGNYTAPPMLGFFMRNCDVLPLSSNMQTMKKFLQAIDTILQRGDNILIYPEQAMWMNYRKPRPLKDGAFKFAVKNNVPIVPIFITTEEVINMKGNPMPSYTVHVLEPIYPNQELGRKEQIQAMMDANYKAWVEVYENVYGEKVTYTTPEELMPK